MADTFKTIINNWKALQRKVENANEPALREAGERILARSQELVPVDTGELKKSGRVRSERTGLGAKVHIEYTAPHALDEHEDLSQFHDDGQAKFLEQAAFENLGEVKNDYAKSVKAKIGT